MALWDFLKTSPPYAGRTWLFIVSDHGRHRVEGEQDWHNHGDQCNGCREIPLAILGPGLTPGTDDAPLTLSDLALTLAALLEVELPHATGQPIRALTPATSPTGPRQLSASQGQLAHTDGGIWLNDQLRSGEDALIAEAAVLRDGVLCWRELIHTPGLYSTSTWDGRCERERNGTWIPLDLPVSAGSVFWEPALAHDSRGWLWLLDHKNHDEATGSANVQLRLMSFDGRDWQTSLGPELSYPQHPELLLHDGSALVAVGASADELEGRDTREIVLWSVSGGEWQPLPALTHPDLARLEHPALFGEASGVRIAATGWRLEGGVSLVVAPLTESGPGEAHIVGSSRVFPHVPPRWRADGVLVWAEASEEGDIVICQDAQCEVVEADAIDSIAVDGTTVHASVLREGAWQHIVVP